jgi:site-specific DNA recombinase
VAELDHAAARDCILYARFSSDRQNPKSCVDQLREAGRYASAHGWRVVGQYQDAAVSGTKGRADRAGWDELLDFIERGGLRAGGIVLTWDIDRWSRDWADGMIEALRLHKLGVSLADTKDGVLEQAGLAGKILLTLKVAGSAEFIDKLRRGVVRGLDAKRAAGFWTQTPPFGYALERRDGGCVLVPDPLEVDELVGIFEAAAGARSMFEIARGLTARGVQTRRRSVWRPCTVRGIVQSPTYLGLIPIYGTRRGPKQRNRAQYERHEIVTVPGLHAPLVSQELWDAAQRHVWRRATGGRGLPRALSGMVFCAECGGRCNVAGGVEPWRYFRCTPFGIVKPGCNSRRLVRIDRLEAAVRLVARERCASDDLVDLVAAASAEDGRSRAAAAAALRTPAQARIHELEQRQERLLEALYAGSAPALINERLRQVQDLLDVARSDLAAAGGEVPILSAADVAAEMRALLTATEADLTWVGILGGRIEVPAEGPVRLAVMGHVFVLDGC